MDASTNDMQIVLGSGDIFRDFGYSDAELRQENAWLAGETINVLDQ